MSAPRGRRLVMLVNAFPSGSETFLVSKFLGLLARGYDVHVVAHCIEADAWKHYPELATPSIRRRIHVEWPTLPRWRANLSVPLALATPFVRAPMAATKYWVQGGGISSASLRRGYVDSRLIELAPDIVHFEFGTLAVERMHLGRALGCKLVVSFRGFDISYAGLEQPAFYEPVWAGIDAVHCLGEDLWQRALRRGCPPTLLHRLISPAIDVAKFPRQDRAFPVVGTRERPLHLVSVGRLHWKKGHEYTVDAVRRLRDRGLEVQLRVLGGGEFRDAILTTARQLEVEDSVELLGSRRPTEVIEHLAWADVLVHASVQEGFCNAVIEAQATGLPVVCSDAEGLSENVSDGETGYVVARRDAAALAGRLAELAGSPETRQRMSERGPSRVRERFRLDQQLDAFDELYQRVIGS